MAQFVHLSTSSLNVDDISSVSWQTDENGVVTFADVHMNGPAAGKVVLAGADAEALAAAVGRKEPKPPAAAPEKPTRHR